MLSFQNLSLKAPPAGPAFFFLMQGYTVLYHINKVMSSDFDEHIGH